MGTERSADGVGEEPLAAGQYHWEDTKWIVVLF
jgi:hypothetical protein